MLTRSSDLVVIDVRVFKRDARRTRTRPSWWRSSPTWSSSLLSSWTTWAPSGIRSVRRTRPSRWWSCPTWSSSRDGSNAAFSDGRALQTRLQSLHTLGIRKQVLHILPSVIANSQKLGRIYESESWHCISAPQSLQINAIHKGLLLKGYLWQYCTLTYIIQYIIKQSRNIMPSKSEFHSTRPYNFNFV